METVIFKAFVHLRYLPVMSEGRCVILNWHLKLIFKIGSGQRW